MSRWHSYLHSAAQILTAYQGDEPFAGFLKKFFAANKKYGSTDRKQIAHLCYSYFRLGKAVQEMPVTERVLLGVFLCSRDAQPVLRELKTEWHEKAGTPVEEKLRFVLPAYPSFSTQAVFPWQQLLSETIEPHAFTSSFFIQPDLFLRVRPGKGDSVYKKLHEANMTFTAVNDQCIALPNSSRIDQVLTLNKEAVVQDLNSQRTGEQMTRAIQQGNKHVWDCCAASGGKSIMAYDIEPAISLTVSDVRESIIANLRKRFTEAGINKYKSFVLDLSSVPASFPEQYDLLIADVPCSGSGTWSRTPEQLYYFEEKKIDTYASLQRKIVTNALPALRSGGHLLYITCSVFARENEENIMHLRQQHGLELEKMEVLKGYDRRADTLFVALLKK